MHNKYHAHGFPTRLWPQVFRKPRNKWNQFERQWYTRSRNQAPRLPQQICIVGAGRRIWWVTDSFPRALAAWAIRARGHSSNWGPRVGILQSCWNKFDCGCGPNSNRGLWHSLTQKFARRAWTDVKGQIWIEVSGPSPAWASRAKVRTRSFAGLTPRLPGHGWTKVYGTGLLPKLRIQASIQGYDLTLYPKLQTKLEPRFTGQVRTEVCGPDWKRAARASCKPRFIGRLRAEVHRPSLSPCLP